MKKTVKKYYAFLTVLPLPLLPFLALNLSYSILEVLGYEWRICLSFLYLLNGILFSWLYSRIVFRKPLSNYTGTALPKMKWMLCGMILPISISLFYLIFIKGDLIRQYLSFKDVESIFRYNILFAGIAGPIIEEIFFRGLILGKLGEQIKMRYAVLISAFVFASCHLYEVDFSEGMDVFTRLMGLMIIGIAFGLITIESGSIWSSAMFHGFYNMLCGDSRFLHISNGPVQVWNEHAFLEYTIKNQSRLLIGIKNADMLETGLPTMIGFFIVSILAYRNIKIHHLNIQHKRFKAVKLLSFFVFTLMLAVPPVCLWLVHFY